MTSMFKVSRFACALFAFLILSSVTPAQSEEKRYAELPNFHQITASLYRGGQPAEGGFKILASLGIKTVLNLRDRDERERLEEAEVRRAGLRYFNVPLDVFDRPSDRDIERVLAIIAAPENQTVFVHCKRGSDRTGVVIACYRITHDRWTNEQAKSEAKRYGIGFWQVKMKDFIGDYYKRRVEEQKKALTRRVEQRVVVVD